MPLEVDETAGDLPVRDICPKGKLMPAVQDSTRDVRSVRKPQVLKMKDRWPLYRMSREQLEEQWRHLQDENTFLKQHCRTQQHKIRRMSTKLMQLQQRHPGAASAWEKELDETVEELEAHVATLETQKETLQSRLSLARQQILELGKRSQGQVLYVGQGNRRVAQTAPPHCGLRSQADSGGETERRDSDLQQSRAEEPERTSQPPGGSLRDRETEVKESMGQQAEEDRGAAQENMDVIHLQKQLSDRRAALLVTQEKFNVLQQSYETKLEESQKSLKESQEALLEKVGELTQELKEERQKTLSMEGQLTTATISLQALEEFQERVADLEKERNLLKDDYDKLLQSTLTAREQQNKHEGHLQEEMWRVEVYRLQEELRAERQEKDKLEQEREKMWQEGSWTDKLQLASLSHDNLKTLQEKHTSLEKEVLHYKEEVMSLQEKLDSVAKAFDMSVEDLSETLLQIKMFRHRHEEDERLRFLGADGKVDERSHELVDLRASHAETVLELQKTREMLLLQSHINKDFQAELNIALETAEREREESKKRTAEKDQQLDRRAQRITTLQAQLKDLAYSPKNYKRTIPLQYTCDGGGWEEVEDNTIFGQLQAGESLLEIHLSKASFTPVGLRTMSQGLEQSEVVTFCTYALLDFEMHSTPLVSGVQPEYGFISRYPLSPLDYERLGMAGGRVRTELHQALGGIQFKTRGFACIPLSGAMKRRGERVSGKASFTGLQGEIVGVLEFWVCLYPPVQLADRQGNRQSVLRAPSLGGLSWQDNIKEIFEFGGGIPNELEVMLERCVGLSARLPGLLPDAYLLYRLYDLPPHASPTIPCCMNPVFNDSVSYPLAVTQDVLAYLQSNSLWVYVFDDHDDQLPPSYLAKTSIPLRVLSVGGHIRGDFVLRDTRGRSRGMVRVFLRWKYPFQPPEVPQSTKAINTEKIDRSRLRQRHTVKPRVGHPKLEMFARDSHTQPRPISVTWRGHTTGIPFNVLDPDKVPSHWSADHVMPHPVSEGDQVTPLQPPGRKLTSHLRSPALVQVAPLPTFSHPTRSPNIDSQCQEGLPREDGAEVEGPVEGEDTGEEHGRCEKVHLDSDVIESCESRASSASDVVVIAKPSQPTMKGLKLQIEILSLSFHPTSRVALDQSVQQVYVEYRLFGVPMDTTETPISLRKPTSGEEIYYNFTRVIFVDRAEAAPLRQYLYTMIEGSDPNQGRLKFTVVSEPMEMQKGECVDVGHAYLDLQELLLTGSDVIERKIDVFSVGEEQEVVGKLKVSLEAAQALTGIYREFQNLKEREEEQEKDEWASQNLE